MTTLDEWADWMATEAGAELRAVLRKVLIKEAVRAEADAKRNATTKLHVRSGRLRNSIRASVQAPENNPDGPAELRLRAGGGKKGLKYAALQEYGGTVRSKRPGGWLAVALDAAKTPAGVMRQEFAVPLRTVPELYLIKTKTGKLLLGRDSGSGKNKTFTPLFVLARSVTVGEHRYMRDAMDKAQNRLVKVLGPELAAAFVVEGNA